MATYRSPTAQVRHPDYSAHALLAVSITSWRRGRGQVRRLVVTENSLPVEKAPDSCGSAQLKELLHALRALIYV